MQTAGEGPVVGPRTIEFSVSDPDHDLQGVRLVQDVARPRIGPEFVRFANSDHWSLALPRPDADRMEYQFEIRYSDDHSEFACDPTNPLRVPGPFGERSALEFPGYEPPAWLDGSATETGGRMDPLDIRLRALRTTVGAVIWTPEGHAADEPLPLLVAHDGPEYAEYSSLLVYLRSAIAAGDLPPLRAALIPPSGYRDQSYSASAAYSRALVHEILPAVARVAPAPHGRSMRVGMGASLGALAMLHVHRANPASFGALFLQSGSFFRQRYDRHEWGFVRFRRISRFVGQVLGASEWAHPIRITMTCGTAEENLANNRAVVEALQRQDYEVVFQENRDAHNWIAWRDTFEVCLGALLREMWT